MLTAIHRFILTVADSLLGWLLYLPSDLVLIVVGVGTASLLVVIRVFTTNQDLLRRCYQDRRRAKELIGEAGKKTYAKELLVGQPRYASPAELFTDDGQTVRVEVESEPVKLFGIVPGVAALALPPWLVAYLLIAVPSTSLLKRLLKIR